MKKLKIGVIGAGGIANSVHLPSLYEMDDIERVVICDNHVEKAQAAKEKFGFQKVYTRHFEMLEKEELDGVFCLVQPDKMYRVVSDCIRAGVAVMMEKPAGINSYQAESLARQAEEKGVMVGCAMNRRAVPLVQYVLRRMEELTPITQVDGVFIKNSDVANCWHYASSFVCDIVHAVDLVRYIAKGEPEAAATVASRHNSPVDNAWSSVIRFDNGVTGTLKSNYQTGGRVHNFEIHGPGASAFINLGFGGSECEAKILHFGGGKIYSLAAAGVGDQQIEVIDGKTIANGEKFHQYYGYKSEDENFIQCLRTGEVPICPIADAVKSMKMVEFLLEHTI